MTHRIAHTFTHDFETLKCSFTHTLARESAFGNCERHILLSSVPQKYQMSYFVFQRKCVCVAASSTERI